ncbi:MAG: extracellular solute-binding protein [Patescibacteria group bacterium]|nr:extracellular solute-binding protein [Patescibacteria group bacterium]
MVDNNPDSPKNQSGPIFESVPIEEVPQAFSPEAPLPETEEPVPAPAEAFLAAPPPELTGDLPPLYEESKARYFIIGGAVLVFLLVFGSVLAFLLTRGQPKPTPPKDVKLVYWGLWEDAQVMQPLIDEYQKANPGVSISYEPQLHIDYRQKLLSRSANNRGPDIFRFHNTWLPQLREIAAPLPAEIISADEYAKTFYPIHLSDLTFEEQIYGIPLMLDGIIMIYNDNLFQRAGVGAPPANWIGDLEEIVTTLTVQDRDGKIVTSGVAMGTANNIDHFSEIFGVLMLHNGGSVFAIDSKESVEALKVFRQFGETNIWNDTMPNSIEAFRAEKVAIIFAPSWQLIRIKSGESSSLPIKTAPLPAGLDGRSLSLASYWVEGVSKKSANQVEAWKFLKYLSERESQEKMIELQKKNRGITIVSSRQDMKSAFESDPLLAPVVQQASVYRSLPLADRTFDKGLNDELISYLKNAVNSTIAGVDYGEALKTAQQGFRTVFERYGLKDTTQPATK